MPSSKTPKNNISLIVGLTIPVVMIVAMLLLIYVPKFLHRPTQNFLYADMGTYYSYGSPVFTVTGNRLEQLPKPYAESGSSIIPERAPVLYVYDVQKNTSTVIFLDDAKKLRLDSTPQSADGFAVTQGNNNSGIFSLFGGGYDYNAWYIVGNGVSQKLNLSVPRYGYGFTFLGWILPQ